jgi:hypothetical protein
MASLLLNVMPAALRRMQSRWPASREMADLDQSAPGDAQLRRDVDQLLAESNEDSLASPANGFLNTELAPVSSRKRATRVWCAV